MHKWHSRFETGDYGYCDLSLEVTDVGTYVSPVRASVAEARLMAGHGL